MVMIGVGVPKFLLFSCGLSHSPTTTAAVAAVVADGEALDDVVDSANRLVHYHSTSTSTTIDFGGLWSDRRRRRCSVVVHCCCRRRRVVVSGKVLVRCREVHFSLQW